jgi:hypothetical protein
MKRVLITFAIVSLFANLSFAQTPANYHYDQFNYQGGNGPCNVQIDYCKTGKLAPFQTCGIQNSAWYASHGTPEVFFDAENGGFWASIWAGHWDDLPQNYGEGLFLACDEFEEGKNYTVSFRIKTCGRLDKISIDLVPANQLSAMPQIFTVQSPEYDIPVLSNEQNIFQLQNADIPNATTYQVSFTPTTNYPYLYIWVEDQSPLWDMLLIDYFRFEDCSTSDMEVTYEADEMPDTKYSSDWIKLEANALVSTGRDVELVAGQYIELNPETTIEFDSEFEAYISPCINGSELDCGINDAFPDTIEKRGGRYFGFDEIGHAMMNKLAILYPNPAADYTQLRFNNAFSGTVEIYTSTGAQVFLAKLKNQKNYELNISTLKIGAYIIKLTTKDRTDYEKLVVH